MPVPLILKNMNQNNTDIISVLNRLWRSKTTIIAFPIIFGFFGVFYALMSPNVFRASSTFILKNEKGNSFGGSLSGLASLAGINMGNQNGFNSELPPNLFPSIIKSNPFNDILLAVEIPENDKIISLRNYLSTKDKNTFLSLIKKYTIGLPGQLKSLIFKNKVNSRSPLINKNSIRRFSLEEEALYKQVKQILQISTDKEGAITLSARDKNPEIAAVIVFNAQTILQQEVINYKIKNAQELLYFTEKLYSEKKEIFEALQDSLASFRDQNQNISSGIFQNKLARLETEFSIASTLNEELAKQVEQAKIQIRKDTPVFTVLEPVVIPNQRDSPKRTIIVLLNAFLGFLIGIGFVIIKNPFLNLIKEIIEK